MALIFPTDWTVQSTSDLIHKFGRNSNVGTTWVPVAIGGIYRTPQPSAATKLRVKAGNVNDTAGGSGARSVTIQGLNTLGELVTETIPTAGASAGAVSATNYIRLFRAYVAESGTYAVVGTPSHAADIVIENAAGTENWATIALDTIGKGQSEIGLYTIPKGYRGFLTSTFIHVDSTKTIQAALVQRQSILDTSAPYQAQRLVTEFVGLEGNFNAPYPEPLVFPELTDIGFFAKTTTGTADVSVNIEISLDKL